MSSFTPIPPPPSDFQDLDTWLGGFTNWEKQTPLSADRRALGPSRCRKLLQRAGLGEISGPAIQVAGTKGKGSTILWMEALLQQRGWPTAATLSPHLASIRERIRIDGIELSTASLIEGLENLHPHLCDPSDPENSVPTFFDLWTALFVERARAAGDRWLLVEVGMGGPLDSTSAISHDVGVLTTVDLDHRPFLGETIEEITREKASISTPGKPFIIADGSHASIAMEVATARGAKPIRVTDDERIPANILAPQRHNGACALAALESIPGIDRWNSEEVEQALTRLQLPARLEMIGEPQPLLLDGAHTPLSVEAFVDRFDAYRGSRCGTILIGMLADKEIELSLVPLTRLDPPAEIITISPPSPRGLSGAKLSTILDKLGLKSEPVHDIEMILVELKKRAATGEPIAATGSMHLAGMIRQHWLAG